MGASSDANSFNSLAGSWSGPEALCGSRPANSLWTPFLLYFLGAGGRHGD